MTNGRAFEILMTLANLKETGKLGYAIAKQRRLLETELTEFIAIRNQAIVNHSDGGKMSEEDIVKANTEIAEYVNLPCEFPVYKIPEEIFTSGGLTAQQMYELDFMVGGDENAE